MSAQLFKEVAASFKSMEDNIPDFSKNSVENSANKNSDFKQPAFAADTSPETKPVFLQDNIDVDFDLENKVINDYKIIDEKVNELPDWYKEAEAAKSEQPTAVNELNDRPTPAESEQKAKEIYGGEEQKSYKGGKEVPYGTPGSTRPDLVVTDEESGTFTAIEVKNYDVSSNERVAALCKEVRRQVGDRCDNMPEGTKQVIVLDVRGQNLTEEQKEELKQKIKDACSDVYEDIQVDIIS